MCIRDSGAIENIRQRKVCTVVTANPEPILDFIIHDMNRSATVEPVSYTHLPCEGLILLKIRQVVPTAGSALPVQIAVPANSPVSTVGSDTCCPVTGVNVVNPINVAVTGAAMVNGTERLLYFNNCLLYTSKRIWHKRGSRKNGI